jgi:glycosyltransferase involved in cell wall biosynthesis
MEPLVSIITPSYNQAAFLQAAMESVLNQDYPSIEYIVVDGGSTDGSAEIIQSYSDRLVWWVSEPDQGQADAINKGFSRAKGDIIAWLNSDDLYLPGAISSAVMVFGKNPEAGLVYGDAVSADGDGNLLNELRFDSWGLADLLEFKIICQPAVFMKRSILEKIGYLDLEYHFFLDHQLWIRLARETTLIHHPEFWAVSRYHDQAKNVVLASTSGKEAYQILAWAEREPDLADIMRRNEKRIWAGAHQINARYLLDGGLGCKALMTYLTAAWTWPSAILGFWHRLIFSGLSCIGLGFLGNWYYGMKRLKKVDLGKGIDLTDWQGIKIR